VVCRLVVNISPQKAEVLSVFYSALLVYASMSEEASIKSVELAGEHVILCVWRDWLRKKRQHLLWGNIGEQLNKSSNFIPCLIYCD
jgi:hypothetical protein